MNLCNVTNDSFRTLTYQGGLDKYTQNSCQATLTKQGLRIYRPPNHDGAAVEGHGWDTWGGFVLRNYNNWLNLVEGRTYIIKIHVKGKTTERAWDFYWSNNVGWGGGGLDPNPSNIEAYTIPSNFNGETDIYYKWTCDSIYKTCTSSYSGFTQGNSYVSYRDFKCGWGYTYDTGEMGTDIYFSNIRLYDITNGIKEIDINKNGVVEALDFTEGDSTFKIHKSGTVESSNFIEI